MQLRIRNTYTRVDKVECSIPLAIHATHKLTAAWLDIGCHAMQLTAIEWLQAHDTTAIHAQHKTLLTYTHFHD